MPSRLGSRNKNKRSLLNRLQDMYGKDFHPIMKMAESAMTLHEIASKTKAMNDLSRSIDAWDKIAKYTEPKLKALDIDLSDSFTRAPTEIIIKAMP